jgi:hypothetical protein
MAFGRKKDDEGDQPLETYKVVYRGGLAHLPKGKNAEIKFLFWPDRFELQATPVTKKWWTDLVIPYETVRELAVVDRQVSTFEALAGGLDSKQLNQKNNIHIRYVDSSGSETILRVEMLTGFTVQGQAKKCLEMQDRLRVHGIPERFAISASNGAAPGAAATNGDVLDQIRQLSELHAQGVLTESEFAQKKAELLGRL